MDKGVTVWKNDPQGITAMRHVGPSTTEERIPPEMLGDESPQSTRDIVCLKASVASLAVLFVAAPVAYAAYMINGLSAPAADIWRMPVMAILAASFVLLAWWIVTSIHKKFPYA